MAVWIPEKQYITFLAHNTESGTPLAFLTPWGTDVASTKRMATADRWASYGKIKINPVIVENTNLCGFKIIGEISRSATSNVVWRIEDPRGFELEISSGNMFDLLIDTVIDNGEIMSPCIWARNGSQNHLVSINSELYKEFVQSDKRKRSKRITLKNIKPGWTVQFENGESGIYLGTFHILSSSYDGGLFKSDKRKPFFYMNQENDIAYKKRSRIKVFSSSQVVKILDSSEVWDDNKSELFINEKYFNSEIDVVDGRDYGMYRLIGAFKDSIDLSQIKKVNLEKITDPVAYKDKYKHGTVVLETRLKQFGKYDIYGAARNEAVEISADQLINHFHIKENRITNYNSSYKQSHSFTYDVNTTTFFACFVEVTTPTGNFYKCHL